MGYARMMVHLELGRSNAAVLNIAADLALKSQASVIGVAAYQPLLAKTYGSQYVSKEVIEIFQAESDREAKAAEGELKARLKIFGISVEWRCAETSEPLSHYLAHEVRCADIILTAPGNDGRLLPDSRRLSVGDLAMRAGRPLIIVPDNAKSLNLDHVLIAWKESREARRATLDALPLLEMAKHVTVAAIVREDDAPLTRNKLADVVIWLKAHGVSSDALVQPLSTGSDTSTLAELARARHADTVVAGAYGHSRLREWTLGGVTADLLLDPGQCVLLSH